MLLSLFNEHPADPSEAHFKRFQKERVLERLRALDARVRRQGLATLEAADEPLIRIGMDMDSRGRVTKNSYGVFNLAWQAQHHPEWADQVAAEVAQLRARIREAHKRPLRFLIWAGMGGSAEDKAMYNAVKLLHRGARCYVLDSTDPTKLRCILADIEHRSSLNLPEILRSTLVVGMAMGMTSYEPVVNLEKLAALYDRHKIDSRANFIYMTLPDSLLDKFARERGYRKVELQLDGANTTAGRHSSPLTRGSLYPLALAHVDLRGWIEGTFLNDEQILTAARLAAFLHAQGLAGRDKVTLLLPKPWLGAQIWTKQDFEESLGKSEELGIKIVLEDKPRLAYYRPPRDPLQDRAFLGVQLKGAAHGETERIALLRRRGYPVSTLTFPAGTPLSCYLQFIHYTVFGLAYLRNMNFVTQPGVELYKSLANRIFAEADRAGGVRKTKAWAALQESPKQVKWAGAVTLHYSRVETDDATASLPAPQIYARILKRLAAERKIEYGELTFFGDTRYCPRGKAVSRVLHRAGEELFRGRLSMPADVYEGPAMNHSYHEMIIGHGRCLSTVLLSEKQEHFAAAGHTADYHVTQFLATQLALAERKRAVVALTLKDLEDGSVAALRSFFHQAAQYLKNCRS